MVKIKDIVDREETITFKHRPTKTKAVVRAFKNLKTAWIDGISTPLEYRGKGGASHVMNQIVDYLDNNKLHAQLSAVPLDKQTDPKKLKAFYRKYGFKGNGYMQRDAR